MAGWAVFSGKGVPQPPSRPPALGFGYWHTAGPTIEDALNRPVRIAAVTWFGAESTTWVPGGLDFQPYTRIMDLTKRLGFNTIRLTFSNEMVERDPVVTRGVAANPAFKGKRALNVFDAIVSYAGKIGLKIILDDQRSVAAPTSRAHPNKVSNLNEPLWYTKRYPANAWLRDWKTLANRYLGNTTVIGFDLRNEPHTGGPGPWTLKAYLHQGATWGPYQGVDNPASDWRLAAEKAGNAILKINASLLIFVEGVQLYPQARPSGEESVTVDQYGVNSYWWGGILRQVKQYPVVLDESGQLVYSPHEYGPIKTTYPWFTHMTYRSLAAVLDSQWGFIPQTTKTVYRAPVFLGETGTCTNLPTCISRQLPGDQATWLHLLVRYLVLHPYVGWSLWTLNGTNALDSPVTDGLLNRYWNGLQGKALESLFRSIEH